MRDDVGAEDDEQEAETLGELMERTRGVMRRDELAAAGLGRYALRKRVAAGELVRADSGAYVAANVLRSHDADLRIVLASRGDRYCAAHLSAAYARGLLRFPPADTHIARRAMSGHREARAGLVIHRFGDLTPDEIEVVDGMRMTTVERTLLDLAATARTRQDHRLLRFALRNAMRNDADLADRLEAELARRGARRGSRVLRDAIGEWRLTGLARSLTEIDFLDFCLDHGLPLPQTNVAVLGVERDAVWFEQQVIGEIDTRAHHDGDDVSFEESRLNDAEATAAGWRVIRVTPRGMRNDQAKVAAVFRGLLLPS